MKNLILKTAIITITTFLSMGGCVKKDSNEFDLNLETNLDFYFETVEDIYSWEHVSFNKNKVKDEIIKKGISFDKINEIKITSASVEVIEPNNAIFENVENAQLMLATPYEEILLASNNSIKPQTSNFKFNISNTNNLVSNLTTDSFSFKIKEKSIQTIKPQKLKLNTNFKIKISE